MTWITLDQLVRGLLLKEGKPLHYYVQYLSYIASGLQTMHFHSMKNIASAQLPVSDINVVTLPCDYVDYVRVGFRVGERVRPMVEDPTMVRLYSYDATTGAKVLHPDTFPDGEIFDTYDHWDTTIQEPAFGHDPSRSDFRFRVFPERGEIQLSTDYPFETIELDYITDGLSVSASTMIDPRAKNALEAYCIYQKELFNRNSNEGIRNNAKGRFDNEHKLYRSLKSDLTAQDIVHAVRSGYSPLPKQ